MKDILSIIVALAIAVTSFGQEAVVGSWLFAPAPREMSEMADEAFVLQPATVINCPEELREQARLLSDLMEPAVGRNLPVSDGSHAINLRLDTSLGAVLKGFQQKECYHLTVTRQGVTLTGATPVGVLRGIQTLVKALPAGTEPDRLVALPGGEIFDYPEYEYRAFLLDCGRHFFPLPTLKKIIDILALHQLNEFHWHLTEDQGWRLEIKRYPRLTEVGSWRAGSPVPGQEGHDGVPVSGFYTQNEAREIVAYADARGIEVIPEIDMPGHMKAALASYPDLGCTSGPYEVACEYGVLDDVLCVGKESSLEFVYNVLDEVMDIFPSRYIHLGGDECPKGRWEACPHCQARILALGLQTSGAMTAEELLQSWFLDRMAERIEARGRRVIVWNDALLGWDNIVSGAPSKQTVIAGWMRPVSSEIAVREGYDAIICPVGHLYLSAADGNRLKGEAYLRRVYDLPVPPVSLSEVEKDRILGVEACLWTERVADEELLLWELLPRLSAVAELQWSDPASRDFDAFLSRIIRMESLYTARGWSWNAAE